MKDTASHIGYIYQITHLPTGRYYIGQRVYRGPIEKDRYMGSGRKIRNLLKAHPLEEFRKQILKVCETREQLNIMEYEFVADRHVCDELCLNLVAGGSQPGFSQETRTKMSKSHVGNKNGQGYRHTVEARQRIAVAKQGNSNGKGYKHKPDAIEKMSTPVSQFSIDGEHLRNFRSFIEAAKACDVAASGIARCARGERRTAGGFRWKTLEQQSVEELH